jgi:F1F0 ATPase subunit 2
MNELMLSALALLAGILLGALFFGGLWWTVLKGLSAKRPALLFIASMLVRTSIALAGFYFVSGGDWKRLLACLLGFIIARLIITRLTSMPMSEEISHAP